MLQQPTIDQEFKALIHGIEFKVEEMSFDSREDAKVWIIENQLGRRNLCDAARIELALCKAELLRAKAKRNQSLAGGDKKSDGSLLAKMTKLNPEAHVDVRNAVATKAGVGARTVGQYMQIKASGNTELLEKVSSGNMKIGTAHKLLPTEIEKQLRRADKMYDYISDRLPFDDNSTNVQIYEKLETLLAQLHELIGKVETYV